MTDITVQLPGNNQLLQRFIASRVSKEREMEIGTSAEVNRGFVTGMDEGWVQMTLSSNGNPVIVRIESITVITETGKALKDYGPDFQRRVRQYAELFTRIVNKELTKTE